MYSVKSKIVINNKILEQVSHFHYLGCVIGYEFNEVPRKKAGQSTNNFAGTIKRIPGKKP